MIILVDLESFIQVLLDVMIFVLSTTGKNFTTEKSHTFSSTIEDRFIKVNIIKYSK